MVQHGKEGNMGVDICPVVWNMSAHTSEEAAP